MGKSVVPRRALAPVEAAKIEENISRKIIKRKRQEETS
jgi:hypothetical protein